MKVYGFDEQMAVGDEGVRFIQDYLTSRKYLVEDVTGNRDYQRQDIDLRVKGQRKQAWRTVEVKTDTYTSGNIYLELANGKNPGCVFKSRAEIWAYWFPNLSILLWISLPALQLWLALHLHEYERKKVMSGRGKGRWMVEGIAVPIRDLLDADVASGMRVGDGETLGQRAVHSRNASNAAVGRSSSSGAGSDGAGLPAAS